MTEKFRYDSALEKVYDDGTYNGESTESYGVFECCEIMNQLKEENERLKKENKELKFQNGELLYQIGEVGKNNKTCRACECFIPDIHYCWMWDMEVEADDVVVACDRRKVKNI